MKPWRENFRTLPAHTTESANKFCVLLLCDDQGTVHMFGRELGFGCPTPTPFANSRGGILPRPCHFSLAGAAGNLHTARKTHWRP
ncbi:hypothetical protein TNIN_368901 [Trichonephila inaurata madagascariensis]|uniref:Uncharacterized protein n=1 Tax=Trichonephila inaurata madagascariensis TaxID=2747483 RepID=A0A8X6WW75_9ARAC|nr:hypothetical protein TNIN_368901 [Trichonephila inaurata madagascariensis]